MMPASDALVSSTQRSASRWRKSTTSYSSMIVSANSMNAASRSCSRAMWRLVSSVVTVCQVVRRSSVESDEPGGNVPSNGADGEVFGKGVGAEQHECVIHRYRGLY